ncbi:DUF2927 domain-containing protein [Sulfitobacter sp. PR48]|uniref:DUF2927 domain-containing protein n=1 Tax=Sulfitobacter sp. PR48 TaxID=3028383 RepID=UPI00235C9CC8|nr:DUF2927 domain-containing protein [Sulfitobacter sp. PR48]MDD9723162.1 DUF2927 domain-containing protein [Sulfitobacter sp. PR48]GLT09834.1 hypothetical protein GCM10007928_20660 [Sulfitobacter porphyrae]
MRGRIFLPLVLLLNACVPASNPDVATRAALDTSASSLPPMKSFATSLPEAPVRSNNDLALDFIELSFQMESGRSLPVLTRFETPISLRVAGSPPPTLLPDLRKLMARLRSEAKIDIREARSGDANITIQAVSREDIRRVLPQAACFVAPNVTTIDEYRSARRQAKTNWTLLKTREKIAIFLPNDASPQEVRDCLHEELAQALGPLNDLYRLPDSVFNDDNVHTVLTGFDMLILRAYYDPALRSGMTRGQVAAALPAILARINPRGAQARARFATRTPTEWSKAIQTALGGRSVSFARRQAAAQEAIRIAGAMGWQDHRRAFAHYAMGRVMQASDAEMAQKHYLIADRYYAMSPGTRLHRAYVATQVAAYAITKGDGNRALRLIAPHVDTAIQSENAALLATLLLLRAEALELENRPTEASGVRLDSVGWARYGFGPDWAVRAKLREIASLNPLKGS